MSRRDTDAILAVLYHIPRRLWVPSIFFSSYP